MDTWKGNVLKLADEIGGCATSQKLGIFLKTVYNWQKAERLEKDEVRGVLPEKFRNRLSNACFAKT